MMSSSSPKGDPGSPSKRSLDASKSRAGRTRRSDLSKGASSQEKLFFMIICAFSFISTTLNVIHTRDVQIQGQDMIRVTGKDKGTSTSNSNRSKRHMHHPALVKHDLPKKREESKKKREELKKKREESKKIKLPSKESSVNEKTVDEKITVADDVKDIVKDIAKVNSEVVKMKSSDELAVADIKKEEHQKQHIIGGLSCSVYGGPDDESATKEMIYWSDIKSDAEYVSPFKKHNDAKKGSATQYMTFEPDGGGWNNIRMAMETVVVMAHAMGRTLVLPPAQGMYLLRKERGKQNIHFSFADFFHLESISREHDGLDIITTEEFLLREAMTGKMRKKKSGEVSFPPNNRTNWDGEDPVPLKEWLREVTVTPLWKPEECLALFPENAGHETDDDFSSIFDKMNANKGPQSSNKEPVAVTASMEERMSQTIAGRKKLCIYNEEMQEAHILHFMCYHKMKVRLLTHFYAFLFFEDWKQQLWEHRFVRDHLRYIDELQCAAARVVGAVRDIAKKNSDNPNGEFDTMHIRRGDFQYKMTRLEGPELYEKSKDWIPEKTVLYIATDERNKEFFEPFKKHYDVYFLDDFKHLFKGLNTNYYGMLDQLIASRGRTFVGTYYSTFTGYINRMRGYHADQDKLEGHELGKIQSYYFTNSQTAMINFTPLSRPFWAREYPVAWRDIDKGIGEL